jgi:hypothetical protein
MIAFSTPTNGSQHAPLAALPWLNSRLLSQRLWSLNHTRSRRARLRI